MLLSRLLPIFLLLTLSVGVQAVDKPRDPLEYFFDQSFGDFSEELATAKEEGKRGILIMFELDECPFCHRMKTMVLNQPEVQDYFKEHFRIFVADIEGDVEIVDFNGKDTTMKDFAFKQHRVRATPVFAFFDLQGNMIKRARYTGATKNKEEFMLLGRYVVEQQYQKTSFTRYKRAQKKRR